MRQSGRRSWSSWVGIWCTRRPSGSSRSCSWSACLTRRIQTRRRPRRRPGKQRRCRSRPRGCGNGRGACMGVVGRLGDPDEMMRRANQPPAPAAQGSQGCPRIRLALLWPPPQSCPPTLRALLTSQTGSPRILWRRRRCSRRGRRQGAGVSLVSPAVGMGRGGQPAGPHQLTQFSAQCWQVLLTRPWKRLQDVQAPLGSQSAHDSPQSSQRPSLANRPVQERRPHAALQLRAGGGAWTCCLCTGVGVGAGAGVGVGKGVGG